MFAILALARAVPLASLVVLCACSSDAEQEIPLLPTEILFTEAVALRVSRVALENAKLDVGNMEPVPYRHGDPPAAAVDGLLARSALEPTRGHVLWKIKGRPEEFHYSVIVQKTATSVVCKVVKAK